MKKQMLIGMPLLLATLIVLVAGCHGESKRTGMQPGSPPMHGQEEGSAPKAQDEGSAPKAQDEGSAPKSKDEGSAPKPADEGSGSR